LICEDLDWYANDLIKMQPTLTLLLIYKLIMPHTAWRLPPFSNMADARTFLNVTSTYVILNFLIFEFIA